MMQRLSRLVPSLLFCLSVLSPVGLFGDSYEDWLRSWEDASTREDLSAPEQLIEQTDLLISAIEAEFPMNLELWGMISEVLERWEASAAIELARDAYVSLLVEICSGEEQLDLKMPDEAALRSFLQRALALSESPSEEGSFLLYLAESWIRSSPGSIPLLRRAESLLQQAITLLDSERPLDAVHFRLGQLYEMLGKQLGSHELSTRETVFLSRAVYHYQTAIDMPFVLDQFKEIATQALMGLRKPELELKVDHRYLPNNDVRLTLRSRNIDSVEVSLVALPAGEEAVPRSLQQLRAGLTSGDPLLEQIRLKKTFSTRGRYPNDWRERELRLDSNLVAGWYGIRLLGEDISASDLLLISPLEVSAFPRQGGGLLVWVSDGETGQTIANATASVFGPDGLVMASASSGTDGLISLEAEQVQDWQEVHVMAGPNPGHLRRMDLPGMEPQIPWVITNPLEVLPGGTFQWAVLGIAPEVATAYENGPVLIMPDGQKLQPMPVTRGTDWLAGSLQVPANLTAGGPIYVELPQGPQFHVGHVRYNRSLPLELELSGEQLAGSVNLFLASTPLGVSLTPVFGTQTELPAFIRLRVLELSRNPLSSPQGSVQAPPDLLYESILPLDARTQKENYVELPDLFSGNVIQPLKIEVLPLDSSEPLAEAYLGLVPFRRLVELRVSEHIVGPDSPVEISFQQKNPDDTDRRPTEGELVVFRETWQNRYIHRRRGTPMSESEYQALPDRSLLGAAKTDFRLIEEGFIREEVRRIPVEIYGDEESVPVQLNQPGYYILEFAGREVDTHGHYPDGPIEIWVMPESGDLRAFRSDDPRLIMEDDGNGLLQVLLLLDRTNPAVLIDIEREDASTFTEVIKPDYSAFYLELEQPLDSGISTARALVVGERKTDFVWATAVPTPREEWELLAANLFGMNPGVAFSWNVAVRSDPANGPSLWSFYADDSDALAPSRLRWQKELQSSTQHHSQAAASFLSRWLPYANPFATESAGHGSDGDHLDDSLVDPDLFLSVFPEVNRFQKVVAEAEPFQVVEDMEGGNQFRISGSFPSVAGRWDLALLSATGHHQLKVESWLVSTELPIRSSLDGPDVLRIGDRAVFPITLENTTEDQVSLQLSPPHGEFLEMSPTETVQVILGAGEVKELQLEVTATGAGSENLDIRVDGSNSYSEAVHAIQIIRPSPRHVFDFRMVPPEGSMVEDSFNLKDWSAADIFIAPGIGALLPKLWPAIREVQDPSDRLLTALCQWALELVLRHHGNISMTESSTTTEDLTAILQERQLESGGWGWFPEGAADPWLSAFIVWTLEMFSDPEALVFTDIRERGHRYLETVLIDESVDLESQLFALRALAMPAFHSDDVRPSRIQARSFLDYLHRQAELSDADVAILLQVAKAYRFKQEVTLLTGELLRRNSTEQLFWPSSLVYLALDDNRAEVSAGSHERLLGALQALSRTGTARSWEQLGGFLNLLAAYYWKGDFFADGQVSVSVANGPSVALSLNPDVGDKSILEIKVEMDALADGKAGFRMDMSSALSPVLVAAIGETRKEKVLTPFPTIQTQFYREFYENTLLQGTRSRSVELDDALAGIQVGNTLRAVFSIDITEPETLARFEFPVPSGLTVVSDSMLHVWEPPAEDEIQETGNIAKLMRESSSSRTQTLSIGPLPAGRHEFTISYRAIWAGSFIWPGSSMIIPRTGKAYEVLKARQITITPESE